MNPQRRAFLTTTALIAPAAAIAGCSAISTLVTPANVATVTAVMADIQAVMPYISGIGMVIGAVVPGVSSLVQLVENGLTAASNVFGTLTATMTAAQAQPIASQIALSINGALTAAKQAVAGLPAGAQGAVNSLLAEADAILANISAFAGTTLPVAAKYGALPGLPVAPVHVFVKSSL